MLYHNFIFSFRHQPDAEKEQPIISQSLQLLERQISQSDSVTEAETQTDRDLSPYRDQPYLETSEIINIDVPPVIKRNSINCLGQSEIIKVSIV